MKGNNAVLRFTLPVIIENIVTTAVGLIFSAILGKIGPGSLAAAGVINQAMSLVLSLFAVITTGTAVLTARLTGEGDYRGASEIAEHALFLSPIVSIGLSGLLLALSVPIAKMLMPTADTVFFRDGLSYFRIMLISLPGLVLTNALTGVLRASGESVLPFFCTVVSNIVQILAVLLFTGKWDMGIAGTGYAYVACRYVSAILSIVFVLRQRRLFCVRKNEIFRPKKKVIARISRIGIPATADAAAVQIGYVVSNALLVSIGAYAAGVYNVLMSLLLVPQLCQTFGNVITTTLVGHRLGGGSVKAARALTVKLLILLAALSALLCVPMLLVPEPFFKLFTSDAATLADSIRLRWILIPYAVVALGVNVCAPAARVGGETKYVMISTIVCIWLIRLPLSFLFCRVWDMGVTGMYLANILALTGRTVSCLMRILLSKWGSKAI